jgi:hypothetical protein
MYVQMKDASGKVLAESDRNTGDAIEVPQGTAQIVVDTGRILRGFPHG